MNNLLPMGTDVDGLKYQELSKIFKFNQFNQAGWKMNPPN